MARLTAEQRNARKTAEAAAANLRTIEARTQQALALLIPLYDEGVLAGLDEDELDPFSKAVNALHDLENAAHHLAFHRDREADRADWTYQDHAFAALVAANID